MGYKSSLQFIVNINKKRLEEAEVTLRELQRQKQEIINQIEQEEKNWEMAVEWMRKTGRATLGRSQHERVAYEKRIKELDMEIQNAFVVYQIQKKKVEGMEQEDDKRRKEWEDNERRRKEKEIEDLAAIRRIRLKKGGI